MENNDEKVTTEAVKTEGADVAAVRSGRRWPKLVLKAGLCLLALLLVLLLAHPLWVGCTGRSVANAVAPDFTGTDFKLADLGVNMYSGHLSLGPVELGNVTGAKSDVSAVVVPKAFSVERVVVDLSPLSLASSNIQVSRVEVVKPYVSCFNIGGTNNFQYILDNVEKKLGPDKKEKKEKSDTMVALDELLVTDVQAWLGTDFHIESVSADLRKGEIRIKAIALKNPAGASAANAFSVGSIAIDLDPATIYTKRIHIKKIEIVAPYVSYVGVDVKGKSMNNFEYILAHVLPPQTDEQKKEAEAKKAAQEKADRESGKKKDEVKVVIDELTIKDLGVKVLMMPEIKVPFAITLHDIGKESDGATVEEVGDTVMDECLKSIKKAGGNIGELGKLGLQKATELGGAAKEQAEAAAKAAGDAAKKALENVVPTDVGKAVGNAGKAVGDGAAKAAEAAGDAAKKAVDGLKNLNPFGK